MNKKKIIASAALTTCLCASLIAGATYALFTSEDTVNIAVTSGKVEVVATVDESTLKTYTLGAEQQNGNFELGGTAKLADGTLTLNNIMPGDKATFDIKVTNNSNVTIKYMFDVSSDGELLKALDISLKEGEADITKGKWTTWSGDATKTINVSVELPEEVGNDYQDKSANIAFTVQAVQGNANSLFGVTVSGITEFEGVQFASVQAAYDAISPVIDNLAGLEQNTATETDFVAVFGTTQAEITWTIYGKQFVDNEYLFSFGRKASRYNNGLDIAKINIVGGDADAELVMDKDVILPYDWWYTNGDPNAKTVELVVSDLTISEGVRTNIHFEPQYGYTFKATYTNCIFNGNIHYLWNNETVLTFDKCVFNNKQSGEEDGYALMIQGGDGAKNDSEVVIRDCTVNGFKRGINLNRVDTNFLITGTTVNNILEVDRPAFQISSAKEVVLDGNTVNSPDCGCAVKLHENLYYTTPDCVIVIKNNTFNAKYLICEETKTSDMNVSWENNTLKNKLSIATENAAPIELETAQ